MAVDSSGLASIYDGSSWTMPTLVDGTSTGFAYKVNAVSCASASFCVAVDERGDALFYDGSSWSSPVSIDGNTPVASVSCPGWPQLCSRPLV
jgi:hypothetical protein